MTTRSMNHRPLALLLSVLLLVGVAACGDDGGSSATTSGDPLTFGEGEIPPAFPDDFPIPANAVIGTTLIDRTNHKSEMNVRLGTEMTAMVQFFNVGLVNQGFVVNRSSGDTLTWTIEFSRAELVGTIVVVGMGEVTQAVVTINAI